MTIGYKDPIEAKPHNFSLSVTKVGGVALDGINRLAVRRNTARHSTGSVADGFSYVQKSADRTGEIEIEVPENAPANDVLWDLKEADTHFTFSHSDPANPNLKINNSVMYIDPAPLERGAEVKMITYLLKTAYLNYRGGSYSLVQAQ
jgi:hypothetical protein